ncbi:hypothetical protein CLF_107579 [Clonorchis sinensis]|uniref:Uncharacterized protein n=1 Tax=Clonorchis sinensis TaxID=79923 RepID=G7YQU5_CLOSI|nr:hypothetical protein CLF_107579 [Clonorchis sinensis]
MILYTIDGQGTEGHNEWCLRWLWSIKNGIDQFSGEVKFSVGDILSRAESAEQIWERTLPGYTSQGNEIRLYSGAIQNSFNTNLLLVIGVQSGNWLGQPGSIPALVQPSGRMAVRHRKGSTTERDVTETVEFVVTSLSSSLTNQHVPQSINIFTCSEPTMHTGTEPWNVQNRKRQQRLNPLTGIAENGKKNSCTCVLLLAEPFQISSLPAEGGDFRSI